MIKGAAGKAKITRSDAEWRRQLTPDQDGVTRRNGTEPPFTGPFRGERGPGRYVGVCCGEPVFDAGAKYDSGTGWPRFYAPVAAGAVTEHPDRLLIVIRRVEVKCATCDAHLGDLVRDGPQPTGPRYRMNGMALDFQPARSAP